MDKETIEDILAVLDKQLDVLLAAMSDPEEDPEPDDPDEQDVPEAPSKVRAIAGVK